MGRPYSVLVVDDHPLLRYGICRLIESDANFTLFGEAESGIEALKSITTNEPDIVLLDLNMEGMDGFETLSALRQKGVSSRVVILTISNAKQDVIRFMHAGADGYLLKDTRPELLLEKLKLVIQGHRISSASIEDFLYERKTASTEHTWIDDLTPREQQVLMQVAKGESNRLISQQLHISEGTVKVHVKNLLRKVNASSRTEVAVRYLETKNKR